MAQAPDTPDFNGTWELNRSENLDEYLKAEVRKQTQILTNKQIL